MAAAKLFYCYAPEDENYLEALENHLATLRNEEYLESWSRQLLKGGDAWEGETLKKLDEADITLILISADLLASENYVKSELEQAVRRHRQRTMRVLLILVRPADWKGSQFTGMPVAPKGQVAISKYPNQDQAWVEVVEQIREMLNVSSAPLTRSMDDLQATVKSLMPTTDFGNKQVEIIHGMWERLLKLTAAFHSLMEPVQQITALVNIPGWNSSVEAMKLNLAECHHYSLTWCLFFSESAYKEIRKLLDIAHSAFNEVSVYVPSAEIQAPANAIFWILSADSRKKAQRIFNEQFGPTLDVVCSALRNIVLEHCNLTKNSQIT